MFLLMDCQFGVLFVCRCPTRCLKTTNTNVEAVRARIHETFWTLIAALSCAAPFASNSSSPRLGVRQRRQPKQSATHEMNTSETASLGTQRRATASVLLLPLEPQSPKAESRLAESPSVVGMGEPLSAPWPVEETANVEYMATSFHALVFQRRVLRIVTSLRRMQRTLHAELDVLDMASGGRSLVGGRSSADDRSAVWMLVKRLTRRVEKLRVVGAVLALKAQNLRRVAVSCLSPSPAVGGATSGGAAGAARAVGGQVGSPPTSAQREAAHAELEVCASVSHKINVVIAEFERLECDATEVLCNLPPL